MFPIALNTFRELARSRIFSLLVFFGLALVLGTVLLANVSMGETSHIIADFGLSGIELFGLVAVVFVGSQIVFKELEGRTIYVLLSKPVRRMDFILGKFLGFATVLKILLGVQFLLLLIVLFATKSQISWLLVGAVLGEYISLLIVFSLTLFFSAFMSPLLSILVTVGVYVASHGISTVVDMATQKHELAIIWGASVFGAILPPLEGLNLKAFVATQASLSLSQIFISYATGIGYLLVILWATVLIFNKKTFER